MRRKIKFYIGDRLADLDEQSLILLNYTMEELSNPTIVKNSFSQQINLPGTPANNQIFGDIFRNDRVTQYSSSETVTYFDPTRKTSFSIYNELGEILESGYLKLDSIVTVGDKHHYSVTLYGGLGSFLYGLSYDEHGERRTLADLDYGETLDFVINASTVRTAWDTIMHSGPSKWKILNFIPSYLGLPPSPFDAQKCIVHAATVGLKYRDEDYRTNPNGYVLVTLNDKVTGNEAKDYRSYLQKPVMRMSAIINAICDPANNGGYTVNLDSTFFNNLNPYWESTWLTLPMLGDLNINETSTQSTQYMSEPENILPIVGGGGSGLYKVTVNMSMYVYMAGLPAANYKLWCRASNGNVCNMLLFTITLYDSSVNIINTAVYRVTTSGLSVPSQYPQPDLYFDHVDAQGWLVDENGNRVTFPLYIEAEGASYYMVDVQFESYEWGSASFNPGYQSGKMWIDGLPPVDSPYYQDFRYDTARVDVVGSSSSTVRTGATITKSALLSGSKTPADYLLSFCKMFGLQLVSRKGEKTIDIVLRKNFYSGGTVDINSRVDRRKQITKLPFSFDAKWYIFGNDARGEYADYYRNTYGRPFGQFRVNTGYDFDSQEKEMTKDIVFNNAISVMETSKYFCSLEYGGHDIPSVFLSGGRYSLYNGGETKSFDLPNETVAEKTWDNPTHPMHDDWAKVQFHGAQNSHIDERDTLVFFENYEDTSGKHLSLTDDFEDMLVLNGNNPCWLPNICDHISSTKIDELPHFSRYIWSGTTVNLQLDWGDPLELQIPGIGLGFGSNIFEQFWEKYITDRYDDDSAVVNCFVDLSGMQVNEELFRQFYFFDGCVWALNRIINYSVTTHDLVQCEFVKVQDITNYTS